MPTKSRRRKTSVAVQYAVPRRGLPSAAAFRRWSLGDAVTIRIVGAAEGRRLNRSFRGKRKATNVLSFDSGDIVLCHPVVAREAHAQGKKLAAHYAHLVVHGVLHLRGYDHRTKKRAARMESKEIRLLRRFGFADPYTIE
jgi:probable rRNA maturation factor